MPRIAELDLNQINPKLAKLDQVLKQIQEIFTRLRRVENFSSPIAKGKLQTGVGNGASTAVTTIALGTGTGPKNPQTIVKHIQVVIDGEIYWLPLVQ